MGKKKKEETARCEKSEKGEKATFEGFFCRMLPKFEPFKG
jgi:hypothetical protein